MRRITGGFTHLTYEPSTYGNTEPLLKIGIRIAKIEEYAGEGNPAKTRHIQKRTSPTIKTAT